MPDFTPNLDLIKPLGSENFSVSHANGNADKIDVAFGDVTDNLGQITRYTVEKLNEINNGTTAENVEITDNYVLNGVQRNVSKVNSKTVENPIFKLDSVVYALRDFTSSGIDKLTTAIKQESGESNARGVIDNLLLEYHNICIDLYSSYINTIKNSQFKNSLVGIRIINNSYSNLIDNNTFAGVNVPLDNGGDTGSLETNNLRFTNNTIEYFNVALKNKSNLKVENTYIGDNNGDFYASTGVTDKLLIAYSTSNTEIKNSHIGIVAKDHSADGVTVDDKNHNNSIIHFETDGATSPTTVSVEDCNLTISTQSASGVRKAYLYTSKSPLDRVIIDKVRAKVSTNRQHNVVPYLLEEDYSPLYSKSPMKNFVIGGTFTNDDITNQYFVNDANVQTEYVPDVTNQYGGKVIKITPLTWGIGKGISFRYRVPKHLVGKPMVLEVYTPNLNSMGIRYSYNNPPYSDLVTLTNSTLSDFYKLPDQSRNGSKTPFRNVILVKPTKENGIIRVDSLVGNPAGMFCEISSITLSTFDNYEMLGMYEDAVFNDIVYCPTSERPVLPLLNEKIYDTTLQKEIHWNGTSWVDSTGTNV